MTSSKEGKRLLKEISFKKKKKCNGEEGQGQGDEVNVTKFKGTLRDNVISLEMK